MCTIDSKRARTWRRHGLLNDETGVRAGQKQEQETLANERIDLRPRVPLNENLVERV
jgi:hypothetical protein